ncbi:GyrI-like domain-containing protein [Wenyingzhuangia sp. IMCC45533]
MKAISKDELILVGLEIRTTNENGKAAKDIPDLWRRFIKEDFKDKIPNKLNDTIYALYYDYQGDFTKPYSMLLGYQVTSLDDIPSNLTVKLIPKAEYFKFTAKGNLMEDAVFNTWKTIWQTDIKRAYTYDLEVYDDRASNPIDGEADILISI